MLGNRQSKMENLVAFNLSGQDNDSYMFSDFPTAESCDLCGYRMDFLKYNPNYYTGKILPDFSATYDGFWIVSQKFKEFCVRKNVPNLAFDKFINLKTYYNFRPGNIVAFDAVRRKTWFEKKCDKCENYESVTGTRPTYLKIAEPLKSGIYRTDLVFASGNEKHPLILVGLETKEELVKEKLEGLEFAPAFGFTIN